MQGKNVVLGITGGIAAYKGADLASRLIKLGAQVQVIMTRSATEFIGPATLREITGHHVITDMFEPPRQMNVQHISLARWAHIFIIAPATANIIGKFANGIADDMLSTTLLATEAPILIAPAMNSRMYNNPIVQGNIRRLKELGCHFVGPAAGYLACGEEGIGRMVEPAEIIERAQGILAPQRDLIGKRVLVTAGPTQEPIDPIRYLTNHSSGKMGYAIAQEAQRRGAQVTLISGPTNLARPTGVDLVPVRTAIEMYEAVLKVFPQVDIVVKAAAVADYRPQEVKEHKIKKEPTQGLTLQLTPNPDILATLGQSKSHQYLVGFAAETIDLVRHAREKLMRKGLDMIIANDVSQPGAGFQSETNIVTVIGKDGSLEELPQMNKGELAREIWNRIIADYAHK
ncbi:MAG: bifunctional phosphopantothenoylcysteine decarboxylase/phosphopantothenate--cysteine ligase CoaBC [Limnochordia bacterium]